MQTTVACVAGLLVLVYGTVAAAPITWQPAQNTTGVANLLTGTHVYAVNGGSAAVTVNGINFNSFKLGTGFLDDVYKAVGGSGPMASTGNSDFDTLIKSLTYGGGANTTIVIPNLVPGTQYQVQVFYNDQRTNSASRVMIYGDGLGNNVNVAAGALAGAQANDYGRFALGTFTADAPTQTLSLEASGFAKCHLNALLVTGPAKAVTNPPPAATIQGANIVVLLTDDQVFDSLHCLGNSLISTPNLDRICTNGMIFRNAHIMGGWAHAVCLPSRTMVMTGRTLWRVPGLSGNSFPANLANKTIPAIFGNAGFDTIRSGKSRNSYTAANIRFGQYFYHDDRDDVSSSRFVNDVLNWITNREIAGKTTPMFIYLGFDHPHDPRHAPQSYLDKFHASAPNPDPNTPLALLPPLPPNYLPKHPFDNGDLRVRDEVAVQGVMTNRDERTIRNELGKVYATIEYLDAQVGRLLEKLDAMNQFTNTFFVFASDNGIANGRHGLMGKQSLYEHSLRVPLAISGPGISPGTNDSLVYLLDLFPTLCDLTGVPAPDTVEGLSLKPILHGQTNAVRNAILGSYLTCQRAVRVGDWKLIHYPFIHRTQLFNLADDPHETNDLSAITAQAGRIKDLAAQLVALQSQFRDWQRLDSLGYVGANVAKSKPAWQSSTQSSADTYAAANATDGAGSTLSAFSQTDAADTNAWWMVDLGESVDVKEVMLMNVSKATRGRLRDISIELLDAQTNLVATSGLLNPANVLGGGLNDFSHGPALLYGGFTNSVPVARMVRVKRAASTVGSGADQNALALAEVQVFAAPYDDDGDGISDRWERHQFGDLTTVSRTTDYDNDGALDWQEAIAGTNPKDPLSVLKVDRITSPPSVMPQFQAASNQTDTVESKEHPTPTFRQPPLTPAIGLTASALTNLNIFHNNAEGHRAMR